MRLQEATRLAGEVRAWLAPACERIEVAGGVRRGKADVGDVEIVAIPRPSGRPVFGELARTPLDATLARLVREGALRWDTAVRRDGPRYKRLIHVRGRLPVDLFLAGDDNWGNILAIRTGDADFARLLVTQRRHGGLMPPGMAQAGGRLWAPFEGEPAPVSCPTEEAFFRALGIDFVPAPETRTGDLARQLAKGLSTT